MEAVRPQRIAKWLGLAYAAAIAAVPLWSAESAEGMLVLPLLLLWMVGPAGLAGLAADVSADAAGAWSFLGLEAGLILWTLWSSLHLIFIAPDAQNGIAIGFAIPFYQYLAAAAFFLVALALGWRPDRTALGE